MDNQWAEHFRQAMVDRGFTMKSLSLAAKLNESFVRDMLQRKRMPSLDKFARLVSVLGMTVGDFVDAPHRIDDASRVPLMGYVGAGAEVEPDFEQVPEAGLEQISVPFPLPAEMIALQVRGNSMLPQFRDGAVIIVYREQRRSMESFYGEEAAVRTTDGRRYIKTIIRGSRPGTVNLISWNAEPIEGVGLAWVGEIFTVFPAKSINRVMRQGGIQGRLGLKTA